jgi:hypothetical protein
MIWPKTKFCKILCHKVIQDLRTLYMNGYWVISLPKMLYIPESRYMDLANGPTLFVIRHTTPSSVLQPNSRASSKVFVLGQIRRV